nr:nitrile hydratase subunit alpha [Flexivirga meconopsidis]
MIENTVSGLEESAVAVAVARAWNDASYAEELAANPKSALRQLGVEIDSTVDLVVLRDSQEVTNLAFTRETGPAQRAEIANVVAAHLPIADHELRVVQSTPTRRYLVVPEKPDSVDGQITAELNMVGARPDGWVWTTSDVVQTTEAVTTVLAAAEAVAVAVLT